MIDFTNAIEEFNNYKGSEKKKTLIYNNKKYLVKFPDPVIEKNKNIKATSKYLCTRCKEGNLRRIRGKNGWFWACSNYPHCTATYDDNNGIPVI